MGDRCTGHCCQRFTLPLSPDEIRENYDAWRAQKSEDSNKRVPLEDIWLLAPMVRYLGFLHSDSNGDPSPEGRHWYRCVHLQDGNCSIYEHRPRMCREYPYGKACKYHGCTWDAAREGRVNEKGEETPPNVNQLTGCQPAPELSTALPREPPPGVS